METHGSSLVWLSRNWSGVAGQAIGHPPEFLQGAGSCKIDNGGRDISRIQVSAGAGGLCSRGWQSMHRIHVDALTISKPDPGYMGALASVSRGLQRS